MLVVNHKILHQPLFAIVASVCSSHHRARAFYVCWIAVNKYVLHELPWLFELQSRNSHKLRNEEYENLLEDQTESG